MSLKLFCILQSISLILLILGALIPSPIGLILLIINFVYSIIALVVTEIIISKEMKEDN